MASLNVKIKDLNLKNPVMTASGTFGYGVEFADFVPLEQIGGIIVKGTTLNPREGTTIREWLRQPAECLTAWDCKTKALTILQRIFILRSRISTRT